MDIHLDFGIGDDCWAMYNRSVNLETHCEACDHIKREQKYIQEIRPAKIDGLNIHVREGKISVWYTCSFDGYSCNVGEKVWATKEEADRYQESFLGK